jgi:cyclopropane-fatty-acyl-phospholipid synthase
VPDVANQQHYEVPPEFFQIVLGRHLKYSCCEWPKNLDDLSDAEQHALKTTMQRANLDHGQQILELGCGWGSLSLSMAKAYPTSKITAVSNSAPQRRYILQQAKAMNLDNLEVITTDINNLSLKSHYFDRAVSVEMFEHIKNYQTLLQRISTWLKNDGSLFVHHFSHKNYAYPFEVEGDHNWMGKYFFTGGMMPNHDLLKSFDDDLKVIQDWWWPGHHYEKTANAWLKRMDQNRDKILSIFKDTYGENSEKWFQRWRVFFIACAECFGFEQGKHWGVSHLLLKKNN